jgi:hypothetical protein
VKVCTTSDPDLFLLLFHRRWQCRLEENFGTLRCRECADRRVVHARWVGQIDEEGPLAIKLNIPGLVEFECTGCSSTRNAAVFYEDDEMGQTVLRFEFVGDSASVATPNTPEPVRFYLDQAARARRAGALSAAAAMYRAALEHLLFERGFTMRMLGPKIAALEAQMNAGSPPDWAKSLDVAELKVLKDIGDGAIHPGDGDIAIQGNITPELIQEFELVLEPMLRGIYDVPEEKRLRLAKLAEVAAKMKR